MEKSNREVNIPPQEWLDHLRYLGGENRYGEANFTLGWAQSTTYIAGGIWSVDESYYKGYRELLSGSGEPCWALYSWHAPEEYGTPESHYVQNYDEASGLQQLGEYPYFGRFEILYNLRWREHEGGKITFHTIPLNTTTFDAIVPIILAAKEVSLEKRKAAILEQKAREDALETAEIERHLRDGALPLHSAVSFTKQGIRSSVIDQKMLKLRETWNSVARNAANFRPGLSIR